MPETTGPGDPVVCRQAYVGISIWRFILELRDSAAKLLLEKVGTYL
ncbi:hypothetical protein PAN31117_05132 [Pandoraea anapnoica]|uniref:Uncharacterized protein n=1 Tax=Pandoraea anapnoica TaxID=2508301 RepID=A0A5E5ANJ8_9BURK|nr:hypothetical protein PAN31117_05132 [Pandoraea anapnoica]